jgi:hypothetical protein
MLWSTREEEEEEEEEEGEKKVNLWSKNVARLNACGTR